MSIQIANHQKLAPIDRKALRAIATALLRQHGKPPHLSICYVDDAAIRQLNARHLGRDATTDVLAFPLDDGPTPEDDPPIGEIIVSVETAVTEATQRGIPIEAEIALYTIHGLLHLLGYDDHEPDDTKAMRQAERQAMEAAGLQ